MARPPRRSRTRRAERLPRGTRALVRRVLAEDRVRSDRTTAALFPGPFPASAQVRAQATGVVSGIAAAEVAARQLGLTTSPAVRDGTKVRKGLVVLRLSGDGRRILAAERTLLNLLMHLSGVATATARAVRNAGSRSGGPKVYATRKTLPGLRDLEKAAVIHGGGEPHRRDLSSAVLIKNNHLAAAPLVAAVKRALEARASSRSPVQVEVSTARDAVLAARAGADALLIDNASPTRLQAVVGALERGGLRSRVWVEASGGITPDNVRRYRRTGVDAVSLGSITHSAPALPFHLTLTPTPRGSSPSGAA